MEATRVKFHAAGLPDHSTYIICICFCWVCCCLPAIHDSDPATVQIWMYVQRGNYTFVNKFRDLKQCNCLFLDASASVTYTINYYYYQHIQAMITARKRKFVFFGPINIKRTYDTFSSLDQRTTHCGEQRKMSNVCSSTRRRPIRCEPTPFYPLLSKTTA